MVLTGLARWLSLLGLDETRCSVCLRPFSPSLAGDRDSALVICPECQPQFAPFAGPRCPHCGLPFPAAPSGEKKTSSPPCGICLSRRPPWRAFAYHGLYQGALRELILRFKFGGEPGLARPLAAWLENVAGCLPSPDALLAIPQHPAHLRRRGYNQAHELARALHAATGIPLRGGLLVRRRDSPPQATLNARMRASNVRGVFGVGAPVHRMRLWLIDDVMTTGNTLREAARTLLEGGAAEVCVLTVARTPQAPA